ncbi:MAG: C1 family peptidase [Prevotella sp.]|nr:C1 family peptidase [Prevotella sp.]
MKKEILFAALSACLLCPSGVYAQKKTGGISETLLSKIQQLQAEGQTNQGQLSRALFNAIASNKIDDLAQNFANQGPVDTYFSVETPKQSIHDQKSSGRCWMFSGLNVLRSNFAKEHEDTLAVEFSHDYLFFYDQLEKANMMLQGAIETAQKPLDDTRVQFFFHHPINDGGTFCGVADLASKYGLVPKSVQPETFSAENTSRMASLISSKLREFGLELRQMVAEKKKDSAIQQRKTEQLSVIYRMLALTLGEPVKTFTYAHVDKNGRQKGEARQYTPKEFYTETVGKDLNGTFIMVMNDPRHEYHKTYEVEFDRHTYDGHNWKYLNLPMDEIAQLAIASLKDGRKLYSSYDVGKQFDRKRGYLDLENYDYGSLFGTSFNMDKAQRISTFDSGSTHAMTLTAVDLEDGKPTKWKVENSWGAASGIAGCLVMTNRWFNEYMFRLVVNNEYVPAQLLKEYEQAPVMLMPEDPLFGVDE